MTTREHHLAAGNLFLTGVLTVSLVTQGLVTPAGAARLMWQTEEGSEQHLRAAAPIQPSPSALRVAERLQRRLQADKSRTPSVVALARAVEQRRSLLKASITVSLTMPDGSEHAEWVASPQRYPLWVVPQISETSATFVLDFDRVRTSLQEESLLSLDPPRDAVLHAAETDVHGIVRAHTSDVARDGYQLDTEEILTAVRSSLETGQTNVTVPIAYRAGRIVNQSGEELGELTLLASGRSNYAGSGWGRIANVRKALQEHVHNVIVPPGEEFSFNDLLGGPVTYSRGWSEAFVIFNGSELRNAPGGGICQASTTVYRAILNAGLPVTERAAHSLYVSYYEAHGVGIDATIFPGKQDLAFINDTGHPLLIQASTDGFDASVSIYGTPDGRSVALNGPYFAPNAPDDFLINGRPMRSNEIGWMHTVRYPDGREISEQVISRYSGMPMSIVRKYTTEL